jgi:WD40-like Beta Propeller Repeat
MCLLTRCKESRPKHRAACVCSDLSALASSTKISIFGGESTAYHFLRFGALVRLRGVASHGTGPINKSLSLQSLDVFAQNTNPDLGNTIVRTPIHLTEDIVPDWHLDVPVRWSVRTKLHCMQDQKCRKLFPVIFRKESQISGGCLKAVAAGPSPFRQTVAIRAVNPWHVFVIDKDGGVPQAISSSEESQTDPSWSRDGQTIAFSHNPEIAFSHPLLEGTRATLESLK